MAIKRNIYVYAENKAQALVKVAAKPRDVGVVYCIINHEVYVFQKLKWFRVTPKMMADGLDIPIFEANELIGYDEEPSVLGDINIDELEVVASENLEQVFMNGEEITNREEMAEVDLLNPNRKPTLEERIIIIEEKLERLTKLLESKQEDPVDEDIKVVEEETQESEPEEIPNNILV